MCYDIYKQKGEKHATLKAALPHMIWGDKSPVKNVTARKTSFDFILPAATQLTCKEDENVDGADDTQVQN